MEALNCKSDKDRRDIALTATARVHGLVLVTRNGRDFEVRGDIREPLGSLRQAWPIGTELDNLAATVNHEKY